MSGWDAEVDVVSGSGSFSDGVSNDLVTLGRSIPGTTGHIAWSVPGTQMWPGGAAQAKVVLAVLPMSVVFLELYRYWADIRWIRVGLVVDGIGDGRVGGDGLGLKECLPIVSRFGVYV